MFKFSSIVLLLISEFCRFLAPPALVVIDANDSTVNRFLKSKVLSDLFDFMSLEEDQNAVDKIIVSGTKNFKPTFEFCNLFCLFKKRLNLLNNSIRRSANVLHLHAKHLIHTWNWQITDLTMWISKRWKMQFPQSKMMTMFMRQVSPFLSLFFVQTTKFKFLK